MGRPILFSFTPLIRCRTDRRRGLWIQLIPGKSGKNKVVNLWERVGVYMDGMNGMHGQMACRKGRQAKAMKRKMKSTVPRRLLPPPCFYIFTPFAFARSLRAHMLLAGPLALPLSTHTPHSRGLTRIPPSTTMSAPVTKAPALEAKKRETPAMSSVDPMLCG